MKPTTVVVSVPVTDLERTLRFYRDGLGVEATGPDEGIITVELPNLSLFLIEQGEYARYVDRVDITDRGKPAPGAFIFSCAIGSEDEVRRTVEQAGRAGGTISDPAQDPDGSFIGFVSDPDGHVWELVTNAHTEKAAAEAG